MSEERGTRTSQTWRSGAWTRWAGLAVIGFGLFQASQGVAGGTALEVAWGAGLSVLGVAWALGAMAPTVHANADGLHVERGLRKDLVPWHEVRGIVPIYDRRGHGTLNVTRVTGPPVPTGLPNEHYDELVQAWSRHGGPTPSA